MNSVNLGKDTLNQIFYFYFFPTERRHLSESDEFTDGKTAHVGTSCEKQLLPGSSF